MRRLSLLAIFLVLIGSVATAVVVRSWAADPPPAAAPKNDDDPFGDVTPAKPEKPKPPVPERAAPERAVPAPGQPSDEWTMPELRPWPHGAQLPLSAPVQPSGQTAHAAGAAAISAAIDRRPIDRILTAEMAASHAPNAAVDALSDTENAAAAKIKAALASKTEIDVHEVPLREVVEQLKKRHKIEIQMDAAGLKDAGVDPDTPVTKHLAGVSLRSALRLVLDELQLKYVIHNEGLLITSPQKAESDDFMLTRIYPVKDLILVRNERNEIQTDYRPLIDLVQGMVSTKSWVDNGGNGTISPYQLQDRCLLVVIQSSDVQEQIVDLLAALRRCSAADGKSGLELRLPKLPRAVPASAARAGTPALEQMHGSTGIPASALTGGTSSKPPAPGDLNFVAPEPPRSMERILTPEMAALPEPQTAIGAEESPGEAKITAALAAPTEINCRDTPLRIVIEKLKDRHKIEIQFDPAGLKDAGVDPETPMSTHFSGISLGAALRRLLEPLQLNFVIHNEILLITSPQNAVSEKFMSTRFYFVKDLILARNENGEIETDFESLIDLIGNTVAVRSWVENGGSGTITPFQFQDRCTLVISEDQEVHEQIAHLLSALRRSAASDPKSGHELRLPRRPKAAPMTSVPNVSGAGSRAGPGNGSLPPFGSSPF